MSFLAACAASAEGTNAIVKMVYRQSTYAQFEEHSMLYEPDYAVNA